MSKSGIKINISTRLLAYFLFVTILPLFFLAVSSALLLNSSLNDKLIQELDYNSDYVWENYENALSDFNSSLSKLQIERLKRYLAGNNLSRANYELEKILEDNGYQLIILADSQKRIILHKYNREILAAAKPVSNASFNLNPLINFAKVNNTVVSIESIGFKQLEEMGIIQYKDIRKNEPGLQSRSAKPHSSKTFSPASLGFLAQTGTIKIKLGKNDYYLFVGHVVNSKSRFFGRLKNIYGSNVAIMLNNNVVLSNSKEDIPSLSINKKFISSIFNQQININGRKYRSSIYNIDNVMRKTVGNLIISIPEGDFEKIKFENSMLISEIALLVALAGIILAYVLARTITKPLAIVTSAAKAIENGDFSQRVQAKSSDELGYLAQSFNSMASALQNRKELEQIRDDLVATLTHDLRVPLLASVQTLEQLSKGAYGNLEEKQNFIIQQLMANNKDLIRMVNTILDCYKYEAGKQTLIKRKSNLNKLIEECILEITPLAIEKHHEMTFENTCDKPEITMDRQEVKRVIINLLSNAIAYTPDGGKIQISAQCGDNDIIVSIKDNGTGISEDSARNLFERYSRTHKTLRKVGTGLGLYLSKQIVEAHNGKIWVESILDQGSAFYFSLPVVEDAQ